ncbi:Predicted polysaccharide deacetylase [gamma proteobacterium HdN1]|nr:Predicted polysaccharide deacetylase [gamma proteobacterium HdN1]
MRKTISALLAIASLASTANAQSVYPDSSKPMVPLSMYCREPGMVALTFDDGPSNNFPTVLATLASHDVKATFFLLGFKLAYASRVLQARAALNEGHQIENHSWDHTNFTRLTDAQLIEQVDSTNQIIWDTLGVKTRFVRPPNGSINVVQGIPIWDMGYGVATWNLDSKDYSQQPGWTADNVYDEVTSKINASNPEKDSFVVLMHDSSPAAVTRLGDIITAVKAKGYRLVTLNECADAGR